VTVAYVYLLGRAPNASEIADWTSREGTSATHASLLMDLLDSAAYATHITG
jgi:hypothetical protein